jgi:protein-S-isoprenylcysteine O-methyltransferase Ste14
MNLVLVYGVLCYAVFLSAFLYAIGFVGNFAVPRSIDSGQSASTGTAVLVDLLLLALFAVQHSTMARPAFKRWWTTIVHPAVERSTYVLLSSVILILLFWQWRALPEPVWSVAGLPGQALFVLSMLGWLIVLLATLMINHFELFGLQQAFAHAQGRSLPPPQFRTPALYRVVRHPIMLGFLIAFWATPQMSVGHLLFAAVTTCYIAAAIQLEERDLVSAHGEQYAAYRRQVSMLLPLPRRRPADAPPSRTGEAGRDVRKVGP